MTTIRVTTNGADAGGIDFLHQVAPCTNRNQIQTDVRLACL
ncbi:MAG: hypothetical protein ABI878_05505 [Acidobacteriota bacterium]